MAARLNEHGVFLGGENVVLAKGVDYLASVELAQHPETGLWYWGVVVEAGRVSVDSFHTGFAPRLNGRSAANREEALSAATACIESTYRRHVEWAASGGRSINPPVGLAINRALEQITRGRQMSLHLQLRG